MINLNNTVIALGVDGLVNTKEVARYSSSLPPSGAYFYNRCRLRAYRAGSHDVLLAEGLPAESYLDTGNRTCFSHGIVEALHPTFGRMTAEKAEGTMPARRTLSS